MKKIYAPWRDKYVTRNQQMVDKTNPKNGCVFCHQFEQNEDEKNLILKRFSTMIVVMNHYPYSAGHLMILPLEHKAELINFTPDESSELMRIATLSIEVLKVALKPHGFNVGLNLGKAGGGGLPSHLHLHILPRWDGDTNFLPLLSDTKVICSDFGETYKQLKPHFDTLSL